MVQTCQIIALGTVPYHEAWGIQKQLAELRGIDQIPDTLLLLEHPHVYTLGSSAKPTNLVWDEAERLANGVEIVQVDRGGDVTYHGPGQLVGYPILKLPRTVNGLHADVIGHVRHLEHMLIEALATFGVSAFAEPKLTGAWVRTGPQTIAKIAQIGVKVTTKAVTQHGFALNVAPDMRYFSGIVPCGIADKPTISMAQLLEPAPTMDRVVDAISIAFGTVFDCDLIIESPEALWSQLKSASHVSV